MTWLNVWWSRGSIIVLSIFAQLNKIGIPTVFSYQLSIIQVLNQLLHAQKIHENIDSVSVNYELKEENMKNKIYDIDP